MIAKTGQPGASRRSSHIRKRHLPKSARRRSDLTSAEERWNASSSRERFRGLADCSKLLGTRLAPERGTDVIRSWDCDPCRCRHERASGLPARERYWRMFENLLAELGYRDYLGARHRYRDEHPREVQP
jgi:hypothetical protein